MRKKVPVLVFDPDPPDPLRGCRRLAAAVLSKAVKDHDTGFFRLDNPLYRFWCRLAGVAADRLDLERARRILADDKRKQNGRIPDEAE